MSCLLTMWDCCQGRPAGEDARAGSRSWPPPLALCKQVHAHWICFVPKRFPRRPLPFLLYVFFFYAEGLEVRPCGCVILLMVTCFYKICQTHSFKYIQSHSFRYIQSHSFRYCKLTKKHSFVYDTFTELTHVLYIHSGTILMIQSF